MDDPFSEPFTSSSLHEQGHHVDNVDNFSSPRCYFLDASGGTTKTYSKKTIQNCLKVSVKSS